ncbi:aminodeoxychorismate synthase component I [Thalassotalea ponticola]|uniref:aminodeoxychorismate synthase component I n=1 Tax=Thalassotalea ponticola TaxID=1523392 RepID=UPI0025B41094|nr:aminodeoxychorismate synthase component I [Thalassotalea ponticola]MDN3651284.1 aminodeoxychorismate synthase component I [Thalassotalea ponticola]
MNQQLRTTYQIQTLNFADHIAISDIANAFSKTPWSVWLDSGDSDHQDSRFDILVFAPLVTITTTGDTTVISDLRDGSEYTSDDDPLTLVEQQLNEVFSNRTNEHPSLPFVGGAVGYFGYDLGRRFETLPTDAKADINLPDMAVGIYGNAVIYDRQHNVYELVSWDDDIEHVAQQLYTQIAQHGTAALADFSLTSDWQANMSSEQYRQKFARVQDYLRSGDCYQINLAQRFSANYQGDEFTAYNKLREHNKAPFSAFMRLTQGAVLSVSPERFLQVSHQRVETKPIKGTRPRSTIADIDAANARELQSADKDRAENLMIVDLLRNDISKACLAGTVKVPSLFAIESFPAVHHLVSTVEGMLCPTKSASDLLRGAFPGGSITGAPKIRAMEIIEELEPHRRSVYCGSIGYLSACGKMDTSITIRTLICENNRIHCWAGGGLVADSKVDSEYQETFDKVAKILPILKT